MPIADCRALPAGYPLLAQYFFQDPVDDQIWIPPYGRGEVRVSIRRQREVSFSLLRVARLAQGAQHEIRKNPLLRLAGDFLRELLIHARRYVHVLRDFDLPRITSA